MVVKVQPDCGTVPLDVGGLKVTFTVITVAPCWESVIVADVNATSVMFSVQFGFGQPGAPGIGVTGGSVVVVIVKGQIARLAAAGLSNRTIAARLYISVRTVDNHLHHAYEKLGIAGRDELPATPKSRTLSASTGPGMRASTQPRPAALPPRFTAPVLRLTS